MKEASFCSENITLQPRWEVLLFFLADQSSLKGFFFGNRGELTGAPGQLLCWVLSFFFVQKISCKGEANVDVFRLVMAGTAEVGTKEVDISFPSEGYNCF